jgi:hypothetical protein
VIFLFTFSIIYSTSFWFKKWVWAYRNDELKDEQLRQGLTKKKLKVKYRDRNKALDDQFARSKPTPKDNQQDCINATKRIIKDLIILGINLSDV